MCQSSSELTVLCSRVLSVKHTRRQGMSAQSHTDRQTCTRTYEQASRQTDTQTDRQTDTRTHEQTDRQTEGQMKRARHVP